MRRPFVRWHAVLPCIAQRPHLFGERFADRFQPFYPLLLLIDRLVEFLDQVFLEGKFGFDVD